MLHFSSSPEYVGLSVITNNGTDDVLFDERLADLGECAKECTAFSCLSFTYNWISGNCQVLLLLSLSLYLSLALSLSLILC